MADWRRPIMPSQGKSSKLKSWLRKLSRRGMHYPPSPGSAHTPQPTQAGHDDVVALVESISRYSEPGTVISPLTGHNASDEQRPSQTLIPTPNDQSSNPIGTQTPERSILYQPLYHLRGFRVLEILPTPEELSQLHCRLATASLDTQDLHYRALSYNWGEPNPLHNIICNGGSLEITPNLHAALIRLRDKRKVVTIWADQICINQNDIAERNQQVRIMRDIYAQADQVLIWLGGDDPAEDEAAKQYGTTLKMAVRRIKELSEEHRREHWGLLQLTHYDYHTCEPRYGLTTEGFTGEYYHWHKENAMGAAGSPAWKVLQLFFARPWFTRIWVVQELAVARSVKVLCGDHELSWDDVDNAAHYIDIHEYGEVINTAMACGDHFPSLLESAAIPIRGCLAMSSIRKQVQRSRRPADETKNDLLELVELTRPTQATDIRDKVIALLGVCGGPASINITPDYNVSPASLFRTTATELIRADGNLNVLSQVFHSQPSSNPDLPSWVPDFADFTRPPTLRSPRSRAAPASSVSPEKPPITPPSFPTPHTLVLPHVWRLARIAQLSPVLTPAHFDIFDDTASAELFGVFKTMARPLKRYRNDDTVNKAFFHCLVGGYIEFRPWASGGRAQSPEILHHDYSHFYLRLVHAVTGMGMMPWNHRSAETYAKAAREKTRRRRVVLTEDLPEQKGDDNARRSRKLLGLGPEVAQVGDWIVVAEGGCVPLVVSKHDDAGSGLENNAWRLVGECYVHGMMDGEVAKVDGIDAGPMTLA